MRKPHGGPGVLEELSREQGPDVSGLIITLLYEVFVKDAQLRFLFVNEGFARRQGITPEQAVGLDDFALFDEGLARQFQQADREAMAAPGPTTRQHVFVDNAGETIVYSVTKYPVRDDAGRVVALLGIADTSTYRGHTEHMFSHWASVVMFSTDALIALSLDGRIQAWSPGAKRMYGYEYSEVADQPLTMLAEPEARDEIAQAVARVATGRGVQSHEGRHRTKDGRVIWVDLTLSAVRKSSTQVTAVSVIGRDTSERVRIERQLKESLERLARSSTELGYLAHAAGHEPQRPSLHQDQIEEVAGAIRTHPVGDMDFEAVAAQLSMSYSHFRRLFREFTGHSPQDYVLLWRMRHAARLLRDQALPVKAIAVEVGYDDPAQFSKTFKKKIGMSPSDFRAYGPKA